eukprot:1069510-Amorphochlora_amoeboformis.AAC.1
MHVHPGDKKNLKIIVGTFKGTLRIFAPRARSFKAPDLRLEKDLGFCLLFLAPFLSGSNYDYFC